MTDEPYLSVFSFRKLLAGLAHIYYGCGLVLSHIHCTAYGFQNAGSDRLPGQSIQKDFFFNSTLLCPDFRFQSHVSAVLRLSTAKCQWAFGIWSLGLGFRRRARLGSLRTGAPPQKDSAARSS